MDNAKEKSDFQRIDDVTGFFREFIIKNNLTPAEFTFLSLEFIGNFVLSKPEEDQLNMVGDFLGYFLAVLKRGKNGG